MDSLAVARGHLLLDHRLTTRKQLCRATLCKTCIHNVGIDYCCWNKYLCSCHFVLLFSLSDWSLPSADYVCVTIIIRKIISHWTLRLTLLNQRSQGRFGDYFLNNNSIILYILILIPWKRRKFCRFPCIGSSSLYWYVLILLCNETKRMSVRECIQLSVAVIPVLLDDIIIVTYI